MKAAAIMILGCAAGALAGCAAKPGQSVQFIGGNPSSVLLDYDASLPSELQYATAAATEKCKVFGRSSAVLESLNTISDGRMQASYTCKE